MFGSVGYTKGTAKLFCAGAAGVMATRARKVAAPDRAAIIIRIIVVLLKSLMLTVALHLLEE